MSTLRERDKAIPAVSSRIIAALILATSGIVILVVLLRLSSTVLKGIFWLLGAFQVTSSWVDILVVHVVPAFLGTLLILAMIFGVLLKTVLLRKVALIRRLRDTAFGAANKQD